jgi:hypothetical protein
MMRFVLALLAMLSGIAALGQPVAARANAAEAQAVQRTHCIAVAENVEVVAAFRPLDSLPDLRDGNALERPDSALAVSRTVRIRCDRALE